MKDKNGKNREGKKQTFSRQQEESRKDRASAQVWTKWPEVESLASQVEKEEEAGSGSAARPLPQPLPCQCPHPDGLSGSRGHAHTGVPSPPWVTVCVWVTQSCPTLCDPKDCSPPGSSVRGILQAAHWSGLPCLPPGDRPNPEMEPGSPTLQAESLPSEPPGKPHPKSRCQQI